MPGMVRAHVEGAVGWLVFDHVARRNAITQAMWAEMAEGLARHDADPAVRVVVMRGAGEEAFVAGADISEFERRDEAPLAQGERPRFRGPMDAAMEAAGRFSKPLIAMIHGHCVGAGVVIAMEADIRVAADDAGFAIPAAKLGIAYPYQNAERLLQMVSPATVAELLFTARRFEAEEALRLGLVDRLVAKGELEGAVAKLAGQIARGAPLTLRAAKATIRAVMAAPRSPLADQAEAMIAACGASEDFREGSRAFLEKRPARFVGR